MESLSSDEAVNMQFELFQEYVQLISEESSSVPESVENSRNIHCSDANRNVRLSFIREVIKDNMKSSHLNRKSTFKDCEELFGNFLSLKYFSKDVLAEIFYDHVNKLNEKHFQEEIKAISWEIYEEEKKIHFMTSTLEADIINDQNVMDLEVLELETEIKQLEAENTFLKEKLHVMLNPLITIIDNSTSNNTHCDDDLICFKCNERFLNKKMLRAHTLVKHFKPIECPAPECDYQSLYNANLKRHVKTIHRNAPHLIIELQKLRSNYITCMYETKPLIT